VNALPVSVRLLREPRPPSPEGALGVIAGVAGDLGIEGIGLEVAALEEKLSEGRFYLACVGQFKRGKSTLLNALAGTAVLPVGVVPVTSVVTVLRHGPELSARVRMAGAPWRPTDPATLAELVSQEQNPDNRKGVEAIEVFLPSPLLASGMCLVDTPGLGSVFQANSAALGAFVPHIDAALVVLGADPPISGEELDFVETLARQTGALLFVLNKADRLPEGDLEEGVRFARRVLAERLGRDPGAIHRVSALGRLVGEEEPRDWPGLVAALDSLARDSGPGLVRAYHARWVDQLAGRILRAIGEREDSLRRSDAQSERRVAKLRRFSAAVARSLQDLEHLMASEHEAIAREMASRREVFLARALPGALAEMEAAVERFATEGGGSLRDRAVEQAGAVARGWLDRWRAEEQPAAEEMYRGLEGRFIDIANYLLSRVDALSGGRGALTLMKEAGLHARSGYYQHDLIQLAPTSPAAKALDRILPGKTAVERVRKAVVEYLRELLPVNATRIVNDLDERVLESRRSLGSEIRNRMEEVCAGAERALGLARARRAEGEEAVRAELGRLEGLRTRVEAVRGTGSDEVPLAPVARRGWRSRFGSRSEEVALRGTPGAAEGSDRCDPA
jgi:GTP-binding protein EngB required for normal cell division